MSDQRFGTLPTRIAVAAVAIPLILWVSYSGGYWFFGFVALVSALSLLEFYGLAEARGAHPLKALGLFFGVFLNLAFIYERVRNDVYLCFSEHGVRLAMFTQQQFLLVVVLLMVLVLLLVELFRNNGSPTLNLGATLLGLVVVSLFFGTLIGLRELFPYGFPAQRFATTLNPSGPDLQTIDQWGGTTIIAVFVSIWICDTAAYFAGLGFGRHKLFERVSPKKTWEGGIAGFFGAVAAMVACRALMLPYLTLGHAVVIGAMIGVFGQLGDLVESRFKRDAGAKDSSALIPGHGGAYDRFDSVVFLAPILYLYIDFVVLS